MLIKRPADVLPSEITPRKLFESRRGFIQQVGLGAGAAALASLMPSAFAASRLGPVAMSPLSTSEEKTPLKDVASYNNFYEFGTDKSDPVSRAQVLQTRPWTVRVEGLAGKPRTFDIEEILKLAPLEERVYRLRCVEAWSMVIPWVGFPLSALLKQVDPLGSAKYVEFISHYDPKIMIHGVLDWPYREGLRMDEAMHPLTLLTVGLYGDVLPKQNGAPLRVVIPWKYGFKSAKSIVTIRLTETAPVSSWMRAGPSEYGFYSNVNPQVDHPRWSQGRERRIGEFRKRPTQMFNGYADQVAGMYAGMDLKTHF
jgi:sulfoxide reductase catalytic subunit YedY